MHTSSSRRKVFLCSEDRCFRDLKGFGDREGQVNAFMMPSILELSIEQVLFIDTSVVEKSQEILNLA
jgi:hypothetical protein